MGLYSRNVLTILLFIPILIGLIFSPVFFDISILRAAQAPTSVVVITVCGNGIVNVGETCDDGTNNGRYAYNARDRFCNTSCSGWAQYCGDGILQARYQEECDDNNNVSGDGCNAICKTEPSLPPPVSGGSSYFPSPPQSTKVVLQGRAYPGSKVNVLQDHETSVSLPADLRANFKVEISDITPGVWSFSLWSEDKKGRKSLTYTFTTTVPRGMTTTISGIFLSPTIELDKTDLRKGEPLNILGITAPNSEVEIHFSSLEEIIKKTSTKEDGTYFYAFDTSFLDEGSHTTKAKATASDGLSSSFSQAAAFNILKEGETKEIKTKEKISERVDINNDSKINLIDFSILLYNWGVPKNPVADLNSDGKVNLTDFSILLYNWTG